MNRSSHVNLASFTDRDMFLREVGEGVGHCATRVAEDEDDEVMDVNEPNDVTVPNSHTTMPGNARDLDSSDEEDEHDGAEADDDDDDDDEDFRRDEDMEVDELGADSDDDLGPEDGENGDDY